MAIRILWPGGNNPAGWTNRGRVTDMVARPGFWARRGQLKHFLVRLLAAGLCVIAGGLGYGLWLVRSMEMHLPDIRSLADVRLNSATTIVSSDGVVLATLKLQERRPVTLSAISSYVVKATVATEDARFYEHRGVDPRGLARALFANVLGGNARGQGGSTITQQLARNLYLSRQKTFRRKIEEILLARKIERSYTKDEILEAYLNTIYYGNGCYGIEAASRDYFGKPASGLTLGEAALLAGLPQRPAAYAPNEHLAAALRRRDTVLGRMVDAGYVTAAGAAAARRQPIHILSQRPESVAGWKAPYFVSDVLAQLRKQYGNEFIYSGLRVETTLNWQMQRAAENSLHDGLRNGIANTGALVAIEPRTGYVRALVGGPDFRRSQFDAATDGIRQPGSAFKPLVYVTAFNTGICTLISQYKDEKLSYPDGAHDYVVHNYDNVYHGTMTILDAIRRSINTVAVQVGAAADPNHVVGYAQQLGISTPLNAGLPLALGDSGVHPIDLCSAYSAFANEGIRYDPTMVVKITNARGQDVWKDDAGGRRHAAFLDRRALDQINVALREVVTSGTGDAAAMIPDAHGKTGTTSGHRDAWFVGYTGDLATAIWVGRERRNHAHIENGGPRGITRYEPMSDATGGSLCAPIWRRFMSNALTVQRHINHEHGVDLHPVPAPGTKALLAHLTAEARAMAASQPTSAPGDESPASNAIQLSPARYMPAQDGSGPIIVTAPPDQLQQDRPEDAPTQETKTDDMPADSDAANDGSNDASPDSSGN